MKKPNGKELIGRSRIIVGILLLIFAIVFGLLIMPKALNQQEAYSVVIVNKSAKAGATITSDMVSLTTTTDKRVASLSYSRLDSILNETLTSDVRAGQYLFKTNVGGTSSNNTPGTNNNTPVNPYTDKVPEGKQLMSVPIPSLSASVSYQLKAGDVIRFYSSYTSGERKGQAYTPVELQYVEIYAVYDSAGKSTSVSGAAPSSIALIVTQEQAEKVVELTNVNKTYFSLMSSGDDDRAEAFLEYQMNVLNK